MIYLFRSVFIPIAICLSLQTSSYAFQVEDDAKSSLYSIYQKAVRTHFEDVRHLYDARSVPNPISNLEHQISLIPNSKLLFYVFMDDKLNIFVSGEDGPTQHTIKDISSYELDELVLAYLTYFTRDSGARSATQLRTLGLNPVEVNPDYLFEEIRTKLSEILLPESILNEFSETEFIIIVPSRAIGNIPFYTLKNLTTHQELIEYHTILLAPHLFSIQPTMGYGNKYIIIGNPAYPVNENYIFTDLPGALKESSSVAEMVEIFNPILLQGELATKKQFVDLMGDGSIIHLATHGIASYDNALDDSFLIFAGDETFPNGMLTAREIQHAEIPAVLVVLSACQTGLGTSLDGGVIGLSRAFLKAGTRNVVMSLWDVDDNVTKTLMIQFYSHLFDPALQNKYILVPGSHSRNFERNGNFFWPLIAKSLRLAKLETRKTHPELFYWAPFGVFSSPF